MRYVKTVCPFFTDSRGSLTYLLDGSVNIKSALLITCKKGSVRANHYHKRDTHFSYIIKGSMDYMYKEMGDPKAKKQTIRVVAGQVVVSPPMVAHAMKFLEDSVFLALTTQKRNRTSYEKDTIRTNLL